MLTKIMKWFDDFERVITIISAFFLVVLTILICTQVFVRYILCNKYVISITKININVFWIEEISVTLMMWIGLFGAAGCVWTDTHMNLNLFLGKIPLKIQVWVRVFIDILIGVFSFVLLREGIILVYQTMGGTMSTLPLKLGYTYIILPISAFIMIIFSVIKVIHRILDFFSIKEKRKKESRKK